MVGQLENLDISKLFDDSDYIRFLDTNNFSRRFGVEFSVDKTDSLYW